MCSRDVAKKSLQQKKARLFLPLTCLNMTAKALDAAFGRIAVMYIFIFISFVCFNRFLGFFFFVNEVKVL